MVPISGYVVFPKRGISMEQIPSIPFSSRIGLGARGDLRRAALLDRGPTEGES